ncbi:MAG: hypothetical protein J0L78_13455 [Planctomycetes bacterium]|nr:hypothetical protein [Planctomycetota bacterium]
MATWFITAALSTAIVGFVWLIVLAFRGIRRGIAGTGPATNCDGGSWMWFGAGGDSSDSAGHHGHDSGGHDAGGCGSGSDGGGGDGGGGGGD